MLEHLINNDLEPTIKDARPVGFTPIDKASPDQIIDAQVNTADWIAGLGLDDDTVNKDAQTQAARQSFAAIATGASPETIQNALTTIKVPAAVQHLVGMLTAYDWAFVEQAKELRGYAVAKLLEKCESPNASLSLKALIALGKVTEVGLFTEKIEVKKADLSDDEIDARIKEKLNKFMGVVDIVDVKDVDEAGKPEEPDAN